MSDIIKINLTKEKTRKKVLIGDVVCLVRKMGNGETLDYNQYLNELEELSNLEKKQILNSEQLKKLSFLSTELLKIRSRRVISDGTPESDEYVKSLTDTEMNLIVDKAYNEQVS